MVHGDGKLVTTSHPAQANAILSLYATGVGPTTPLVDFGQPFAPNTVYHVNAPVEVLVNGQPVEVLYAGGYGGSIDGYQINFRLPAALNSGSVGLQMTAAWIPGAEVRLPVE